MGGALGFVLAAVKPHLEGTGLGGKGLRENRVEPKQMWVGQAADATVWVGQAADATPSLTPAASGFLFSQ